MANILLVTATKIETTSVLECFCKGETPQRTSIQGRVYFDLGLIHCARVFLTQSEMGHSGIGGSQQSVAQGISAHSPVAVIMVGIAFGVNQEKQKIGDILVTEGLRPYDLQRVGPEVILRTDRPHASSKLINLFRSAEVLWKGADVRFGILLSGEKLVDNLDIRNQLVAFEPEAIGGEMEGTGLYVACQDAKVDWILVKGICDFADGHKSENKTDRQALAARNAAAFVHHVLNFVAFDWNTSGQPTAISAGNSVKPVDRVGQRLSDEDLAVEDSGDWVYLHNFFFRSESIEVTGKRIQMVLKSDGARDDADLRTIESNIGRGKDIGFAWGNDAGVGRLVSVSSRQSNGLTVWTVAIEADSDHNPFLSEMAFGVGGRTYTPDEIAIFRARRILLDEKPPFADSSNLSVSLLEAMIRGTNTRIKVDRSLLPLLFENLRSEPLEVVLRLARLFAIFQLRNSGVVEHVQHLRLGPLKDGSLKVSFRGKRYRRFSNVEPGIIEVEGVCPLTSAQS